MIFHLSVLWIALMGLRLADAVYDFNVDDYEQERKTWKSPHDDVFSVPTQTPPKFAWSEAIDKAPDGSSGGQVHAALRACQNEVLSNIQQTKATGVYIRRLVTHLLNIYDETDEELKGVVFMNVDAAVLQSLKSFADNGEFSSSMHSNVHDLLKDVFVAPPKSILQRALNVVDNLFVKPTAFVLDILRSIFLSLRLGFSDKVYIGCTLAPVVFLYSYLRKNSPRTCFVRVVVYLLLVTYLVELEKAKQELESREMSKSRNPSRPWQCKHADDMTMFESLYSSVTSLFSGNKEKVCESYYQKQFEEIIDPGEIFWKIIFSPFVPMLKKLGLALGEFYNAFGNYTGWATALILYPVGTLALIYILGLISSALFGGSMSLPFGGTFNMWRRSHGRENSGSVQTRSSSAPNDGQPGPSVVHNYNIHNYAPNAVSNLHVEENPRPYLKSITESCEVSSFSSNVRPHEAVELRPSSGKVQEVGGGDSAPHSISLSPSRSNQQQPLSSRPGPSSVSGQLLPAPTISRTVSTISPEKADDITDRNFSQIITSSALLSAAHLSNIRRRVSRTRHLSL